MEIESVRSKKTFVSTVPTWQSLIKEKQRTTAPLSNIADPVKRNQEISKKKNGAKRSKKWREENPEKSKAATKKWREDNPEKVKEYNKKWREENPDKVKLYQERNKKNVKAWAEAHPERKREIDRKSDKKRNKSPKRKAWTAEYLQRPEVKERHRENDRKRNRTPERLAQFRIYGAKKRAKKKAAALFALLCNIPKIKAVE